MSRLFTRNENGSFSPSAYARGPFKGLQGGAVASLLCRELDQCAAEQGLGEPVTVTTSFLSATPGEDLTTRPEVVRSGSRASVLRNELWAKDRLCATATLTVMQRNELAGIASTNAAPLDPLTLDAVPLSAARARPHAWLMDLFEVRPDAHSGTSWFGIEASFAATTSPLEKCLLAADWAHGINRPIPSGYADPNLNLVVHLLRQPKGRWIGVQAATEWEDGGIGLGHGALWDIDGRFGAVSMSVAIAQLT